MRRLIVLIAATAALGAGCGKGGAVGAGPVDSGTRTATTSASATPSETHGAGSETPTATPTGGGTPTSPSETTTPTSPPATGTVSYEVWFTLDDRLQPVVRTQPTTRAIGSAALSALLAGTREDEAAAGFGTQVPPGTTLRGLTIPGNVATVNLSAAFLSGGSAVSEFTRIGQVVLTISQFSSVEGVTIELDGQPVKPFGIDGRALDRPWEPGDFEPLLPAILVGSPTPGQVVTSPVTVTGTADVFEATVSLRVLDSHGRVLADTVTTATCGTGCRGDFSKAVSFAVDHEQRGVVMVFEASAEDGRPINVVRIPVTLSP
jgi:spore germination protein GerM